MPRRLQCIFCQYTFVIADDEEALGDCPSCGTELLDHTYIVDLGPVTNPGPIHAERTLEQPLTAVDLTQASLDATVPLPAMDMPEDDENACFEDITSERFDDGHSAAPGAGLDATNTLEMTPEQRDDELSFGELVEPRPAPRGNGVRAVATMKVDAGPDANLALPGAQTVAVRRDDAASLAVEGGDEVDDPFYADEATVSNNLDLEALAAVSTGRSSANRRPRWRCTTCLAEFPGSRPQTCPACGSALRPH